jgi:hypothetical protein
VQPDDPFPHRWRGRACAAGKPCLLTPAIGPHPPLAHTISDACRAVTDCAAVAAASAGRVASTRTNNQTTKQTACRCDRPSAKSAAGQPQPATWHDKGATLRANAVGRRTLPMPSCGAALCLARADRMRGSFRPGRFSHALIRRRRSLPVRAPPRFRLVGPPQREARAAAAEQMITHVAQLNAAYATRAITGVRRPARATKQANKQANKQAARQRQNAAHSRAHGRGRRRGGSARRSSGAGPHAADTRPRAHGLPRDHTRPAVTRMPMLSPAAPL